MHQNTQLIYYDTTSLLYIDENHGSSLVFYCFLFLVDVDYVDGSVCNSIVPVRNNSSDSTHLSPFKSTCVAFFYRPSHT